MAYTETYHCDVCGKAKNEESEDWWLAWADQIISRAGRACAAAAEADTLEPAAVSFRAGEAHLRSALRPDADGPLDDQPRGGLSPLTAQCECP